jgi:hypothetical protein
MQGASADGASHNLGELRARSMQSSLSLLRNMAACPPRKSARLSRNERPHNAAFPELIEIIRPCVHHCDAFGPILGAVRVRSAHSRPGFTQPPAKGVAPIRAAALPIAWEKTYFISRNQSLGTSVIHFTFGSLFLEYNWRLIPRFKNGFSGMCQDTGGIISGRNARQAADVHTSARPSQDA